MIYSNICFPERGISEDYSKFAYFEYNRKVNQTRVNLIKTLIVLFKVFFGDIIVVEYRGKWYIIDGQHRFAALKEMGLPIPYQILEVAEDQIPHLISSINTSQWRFGLQYFLGLFIPYNRSYRILADVVDKYQSSIGLESIIMAFSSNVTTAGFKTGKYNAYETELNRKVVEVLDYLSAYKVSKMRRFKKCVIRLARAGYELDLIIAVTEEINRKSENLPDNEEALFSFLENRIITVRDLMNKVKSNGKGKKADTSEFPTTLKIEHSVIEMS